MLPVTFAVRLVPSLDKLSVTVFALLALDFIVLIFKPPTSVLSSRLIPDFILNEEPEVSNAPFAKSALAFKSPTGSPETLPPTKLPVLSNNTSPEPDSINNPDAVTLPSALK